MAPSIARKAMAKARQANLKTAEVESKAGPQEAGQEYTAEVTSTSVALQPLAKGYKVICTYLV